MKKQLIAMVSVGLALSGCGTVKQVDTNAWAKDYYTQPNTANIASIEGDNVELTIKGAKKIVLNTPVPQKSIIPRDPGVLDSIGGLMGNTMPWLAGMYLGGKLADRPATVQAQIVKPDVYTIPAQ